MEQHGLILVYVAFSNTLSACNHAGNVEEGYDCIEHYNCMVDLLGRGGQLKEAKAILDSIIVQTNITGWLSLLTSCRIYTDPLIGRQCFDKIMEIEPTEARGYMLMSNIYADSNMWSDVEKIQHLRKRACAWRKPGKACIEIDNKVFEFSVGGKINPQSILIYKKLDMLNKSIMEEGYVPHLEVIVVSIIEFQPQ